MPTNGLHQVLKIQFGLVNDTDRYLTAESFGFKVNASAPSLKRKQMWVLEPDPGQGTAVLFRSSHLGRYLSAEEDGRVGCGAERPGPDCRFLVLPQPDGRWVLQSEPHGRFFGGTEDQLSCFATTISTAELWTVHLAIHPQAHLLSVSRRRYVHLCPQEDEMAADGDMPWGVEALLTLIFQSRRYCLKSSDSRYLRSDGRLVREPEAHACYTLEFKAGKLAFKDCDGRYLAPTGPAGTLKAGRNTRPSKDELFDLEESHPQVVLVAANHRYVSVRQGVNVSANQDEELDHETFLMQIDQDTKKCTFYSSTGGYWTLVTHGGIQATATQVSASTMFEVEWRGRRVALKASNGRYVCMKKNGQLAAISDFVGEHSCLLGAGGRLSTQAGACTQALSPLSGELLLPGQVILIRVIHQGTVSSQRVWFSPSHLWEPWEPPRLLAQLETPRFHGIRHLAKAAHQAMADLGRTVPGQGRGWEGGSTAPSPAGEDEEFILKLINRPILVLRGLDGFVCHRRGSNQLDTNRSVYDVFHLSFSDGAYQIRGRGGGFWYTGSHGSVCSDGESAEDFLFEFCERGRLAIRARSGKYLRGGASGLLRADADVPSAVALWEY
ncbi:fascin-2 isoform X2 [Marmota marmota marmota]|uniref:fascin-2 isoform X2 n=1 Tax=Marmota marmota marmota TaxID=9994 RepID=UPI0020922CE2|nr:fascin-2 isoform X2 [Marmota marmota marmota]